MLFRSDMYDLWTIYTEEDNELKVVGLEINNPAIAKQVLQNSISDVLTSISDNLDSALDKTKTVAFFTDLAAQHRDKPKLTPLITSLKTQFSTMSS